MKILSYEYKDPDNLSWQFPKVNFGNINLIVGVSASGKTKYVNTIFNLAKFVAAEGNFVFGHWIITFDIDEVKYSWELETDFKEKIIKKEKLYKTEKNEWKLMIDRDTNTFMYNGVKIPKLASNITSINLLKEEEEISPIYLNMSKIIRRETTKNDKIITFVVDDGKPEKLLKDKFDMDYLAFYDLPLSMKLYILKKKQPEKFKIIKSELMSIFPSIKNLTICDIKDVNPEFPAPGKVPVLCIEEKNVHEVIDISSLSSGLQKVILLITDILTLPEGSIYIIDEYENSLGINAINFLPNFLYENDILSKNQIFITSHHPYLINNIPVENWYIMHRNGSKVTISYGEENVKRYGKSKQEAFTSLINDDFYVEGIE